MKMAMTYTMLVAITALSAQLAFGQEKESTTTSAAGSAQSQYLKMSDLLGAKVENTQGENIGTISDVAVSHKGKIHFAVLGVGGFLGIGEKLTPVPWNLINASPTDKKFVLNVDKEKLKSAPTIQQNQWSQLDNPQYISQVYSYYGVQAPEAVGGTGALK